MLKKNLKFYLKNINNDISILNVNATFSLGKLDGYLNNFKYLNFLHLIISLREAKLSSQIEGIRTTYSNLVDKIVENKFGLKTKFDEVFGCYQVLNSFNKSDLKIINNSTLYKIQTLLRGFKVDSVRKNPFVRIVDHNKNTIYQPPKSFQEIYKKLDELEEFINNNNYFPLIKLAIIHYQFEAIHPFDDGNGRSGRILNILYLMYCNLIKKPIFSLSEYIYNNKSQYYELLQLINKDDQKIYDFISYFLEAIDISSKRTIKTITIIQKTADNLAISFQKYKWFLVSQIDKFIDKIFFSLSEFSKIINKSLATARKYLKELLENQDLVEFSAAGKKCYMLSAFFTLLVEDK